MDESDLLNTTEDDLNESTGRLKIDLDEDDSDSKTRKLKRKRLKSSDSSDDDETLPENCLQIEEKVCKTAAKNHLTHSNVKNILKRVVSNEHVIAMVILQEEKMQNEESSTITRSKAKKMMKTSPMQSWPLPMTPVKMPKLASPEVTSLIAQDLPDEESDEEYQPHPDEHSDDETDTQGSLSDVDSQPRTPATPGRLNNDIPDSPPKWTEDGLFKLPKVITPVKEKEITTEATIALRTRSKLCLSDTPIETIEESFFPPDITEDMYDFGDCGLDDNWKNFLTDFTKPLPQTHEDDDEADPEYNADADKRTCELDAAEELRQDRALKVTKKELKDLVAELSLQFEDIFDPPQEAVLTAPNSNLVPIVVLQNENLLNSSASFSPQKFLDISKPQIFQKTEPEYDSSKVLAIGYNPEIPGHNEHIQMNGNMIVEGNQGTQVPLQIDVGCEPYPIVPGHPTNLLKTKSKPFKNHVIVFNEEEWIYKETDANLEQMQRQILDQQMRQHVQIATQCFLQLHGHPEYWEHGPKEKEILMSLKFLSGNQENSAFNPCNLNNAIKLCEEWEATLAKDNDEMRDMMKFIEKEIYKSKRRRSQHSFYACKFPQQFIDAIIDSDVFIYPELLPSIPFRVDLINKTYSHVYLESEDRLIALGLSEFYKYISANKDLFPGQDKGFQYRTISELLSKYLLTPITPSRLKGHIKVMKNPKLPDNPIQYYYKHLKPPETKHRILSFGPQCTPRDHHKDLLPYMWRNILYPRVGRKEASFRKAVGAIEPLKSFVVDRNRYFQTLCDENGYSAISGDTRKSGENCNASTVAAGKENNANIEQEINENRFIRKSQLNNRISKTHKSEINSLSIKGRNGKIYQENNVLCNKDLINSNGNANTILLSDGSRIQIYQPGNQSSSQHFQLNKCKCAENTEEPILKGQTLVTKFFSSTKSSNSANLDNNFTSDTNSNIDKSNRINKNKLNYFSSKERIQPPKLLRHPNGRFISRSPKKRIKSSVLTYKLRCLLVICEKRKSSQRRFKSDVLEKFSNTLAAQIAEIENNMLPSMPHLSSASKQNIELSDDSNDVTVQPPLPDTPTSICTNNDAPLLHTSGVSDSTTKKSLDDRPPVQARGANKPTVAGNTSKHRLALKMQKELDANMAMLTTDRYADNLKDTLFATAYFERVQMRLNSDCNRNNSTDSEQFVAFQRILETFDPQKQSPCDLYHTLEKLFGSKNADLTEEFLAFLTAGQAAEIGRFMDHFLLISMTEFIERLQIYFARKPAQLRKILWCLERLVEDVNNSENGEISMDTVRTTILPHLKSSQYLVDWFLKLFPGEKPPESYVNNGYEVLDIERMAKDYVEDPLSEELDHEVLNIPPIEENYGNDSCTCMCHNSSDPKYKSRSRHCIPCGMKYIQGRVYIQHGRGLRAAHLTWGKGDAECTGQISTASGNSMAAQARRLSAPAARVTRKRAASLDPPQTRTDSDDERVSPKRILRFLRTPTSKNKYNKSIQISKNLNKSLDSIEESHMVNKPSCSKSIMKDVDKPDNKPSSENLECLAEAFPEPCEHEEVTIFHESDQQISLIANRLKGERRDSGYTEKSPMEHLDECENDCQDGTTISEQDTVTAQSEKIQDTTSITDNCSPNETTCDREYIKEEPNTSDQSIKSVTSTTIKIEEEGNWTRDEDKAILLVLQCASDTENTFEKINTLLPHRSMSEIRGRFLNVMQLLQQMASQPE